MILLLAGASIWGFINLTNAPVGPIFVSYLLIGILAFAPIPFLGYRAYALFKADYYIDRDSLAILWGLRVEDIPLTDIEWVRPASDLTNPLSLPRFRLPGAVLGTRRHPDLGAVEFIASTARNLILIATSKHVFAISPRNAAALVRTFRACDRVGQPYPYGSKIGLSILCHHTGMGKPDRPLSVADGSAPQPWPGGLGRLPDPFTRSSPVWVQPIRCSQ